MIYYYWKDRENMGLNVSQIIMYNSGKSVMSKIYKLRNIISIFCTNTEESTRKIAKKSRKRYLQGSWSENCHLCIISISVLLDLLSNVYVNLKFI